MGVAKYIVYTNEGFKEGKTETLIHPIALEEAAEAVTLWQRVQLAGLQATDSRGQQRGSIDEGRLFGSTFLASLGKGL